MRIRILLLSLFVLCLSSAVRSQQEKILLYDVEIEVNKDRSIDIVETIEVDVKGQIIKRGITRSLPTSRTYVSGKRKQMSYDIQSVTRNGKTEDYHIQSTNGRKTLYLGQSNVFLPVGVHTYKITYHVSDQIETLGEIDELYWNAIGTDVQFPIEKASCLVKLPGDIKVTQHSCYTGSYGSRESDCTSEIHPNQNLILYKVSRSLKPKEAFSVGVGFEKGLIDPPSFFERFRSALVLGLSLLTLLVYFVFTWNKHGVDPPKPTPYPQFAAPDNYSPAAISYIENESYKPQQSTASIIDLAIKGYLRIEENDPTGLLRKRSTYTLKKLKNADGDFYPEEREMMKKLFGGSDRVELSGEYNPRIRKALTAHELLIKDQFQDFVTEGNNRNFLIFPIALSFISLIAAYFLMRNNAISGQSIIPLLVFVPFIALPLLAIYQVFRRGNPLRNLPILLFFGIFLFMSASSILPNIGDIPSFLSRLFSGIGINQAALVLFLPLAIVSLVIYAFLIKKPTVEKLQLQSDIEGFRMYLNMAEKERLNLLNPPDKTPEHFEQMLPFAFALGVQHQWSELFKSILEKAAYVPQWTNSRTPYIGGSFSNDLNRTLNQSAIPPAPKNTGSGGSGGGGFAGGGGGGGGVGGW